MIKLKHLLREEDREKEILTKLEQNQKEMGELLEKEWGVGGTQERISNAFAGINIGMQPNVNNPMTEDDFKKMIAIAKSEESKIRDRRVEISEEDAKLYQELIDMGKEDLVEKIQTEEKEKTEKIVDEFIQKMEIAHKQKIEKAAEEMKKMKSDSDAKIESLKQKQKNYIENLKKEMEKRTKQYGIDYDKWLSSGAAEKGMPPPIPPSVKDVEKELGGDEFSIEKIQQNFKSYQDMLAKERDDDRKDNLEKLNKASADLRAGIAPTMPMDRIGIKREMKEYFDVEDVIATMADKNKKIEYFRIEALSPSGKTVRTGWVPAQEKTIKGVIKQLEQEMYKIVKVERKSNL